MTNTQSPPRYQIFHDLTQEFANLIKKLEVDLSQRLNSSSKGPKKPFGGIWPKNTTPTGKSSFWPNLGGLRGLGKWIWTGKAENFINNINKMTLKEYVECENEINLICEEIIQHNFKLNENYQMVSDIIEKFKNDAIEIVKRYAKKVEEEQAREEKAFLDLSRQVSLQHGSPETMSDEDIKSAYEKAGLPTDGNQQGNGTEDDEEGDENRGPEPNSEEVLKRGELGRLLVAMKDIKEDKDAEVDGENAFDFILEMLITYKKLPSADRDEFLKDLQEESKRHPYYKLILIIIEGNFTDKILGEFVPSTPKGTGDIN